MLRYKPPNIVRWCLMASYAPPIHSWSGTRIPYTHGSGHIRVIVLDTPARGIETALQGFFTYGAAARVLRWPVDFNAAGLANTPHVAACLGTAGPNDCSSRWV